MRLIGSFHTITTHGRSGVTAVSSVGSSTSTGLMVGADITRSRRRQHGFGRDDPCSIVASVDLLHAKHESEHGDPHADRAEEVDADEHHGYASEVLRVPHC